MHTYILSVSSWWFIRLSNAFIFCDPEPPIINVLYEWSGMCDQFRVSVIVYSSVTLSELMTF